MTARPASRSSLARSTSITDGPGLSCRAATQALSRPASDSEIRRSLAARGRATRLLVTDQLRQYRNPIQDCIAGDRADQAGEVRIAGQALPADDVFEKDTTDRRPSRHRIEQPDIRKDVVRRDDCHPAPGKDCANLFAHDRIPGQNNWYAKSGRAKRAGIVQQHAGLTAVGPAQSTHSATCGDTSPNVRRPQSGRGLCPAYRQRCNASRRPN